MSTAVAARPSSALTIDQVLDRARTRITRITPEQAYLEHVEGALLVDIRPAGQRLIEGEVPGALVIERNVLEWRLDPTSDARLPQAVGYDLRVLVLCSEGYTSSLAAASLVELGLRRATDVEGGFLAWRAAGLPTTGQGLDGMLGAAQNSSPREVPCRPSPARSRTSSPTAPSGSSATRSGSPSTS